MRPESPRCRCKTMDWTRSSPALLVHVEAVVVHDLDPRADEVLTEDDGLSTAPVFIEDVDVGGCKGRRVATIVVRGPSRTRAHPGEQTTGVSCAGEDAPPPG